MADSTLWRELAREFRALPSDNTYADQVIKPISENPRSETPPNLYWWLHSNSHHVAIQFEALAIRAGNAFWPGGSADQFQVWMDALWGYNANIDTHTETSGREPHVFVEVKKRIRNLSETSALFCSSLEIHAFREESAFRAENRAFVENVTDSKEGIPAKAANRKHARRAPDIDTSRKRIELVDTLARELARVKAETRRGYCAPDTLKVRFPNFTLWTLLENSELKKLTEGETFFPKAYASNLVLAHYGLTSRETLKKDRQKLRNAQRASERRAPEC